MRILSIFLGLFISFVSIVEASDEGVPLRSKPVLSDAECYEFFGMYCQLNCEYRAGKRGYVPVNTIDQQLQDSKSDGVLDLVRALGIELSMDHIRRAYQSHGVLQLRPFNGVALLIGCGNSPIEENYNKPVHVHDDYDTINPELTMNPTLVAALGVDDLRGLLPCTYAKVLYEGIDPLSSEFALTMFKHHFGQAKVYDITYNNGYQENLYHNIESMVKEYQDSWADYRREQESKATQVNQSDEEGYSGEQTSEDYSTGDPSQWFVSDEEGIGHQDLCPLCHQSGGCDCPE